MWRWAVVAALLTTLGPFAWSAGRDGPEPAGPLTADELAELDRLAAAATVEISAVGCSGLSIGSGFGIGGRVVTNRHLVAGAAEAKVQRSGTLHRSTVVAVHEALDLAVLADIGGPDLRLAPDRPEVGTPVVLAGRPGAGPVVVRSSSVHLYSEGATWAMAGEVMLLDVPTGPGWSGGPVLDRRGRVVAVLAAQDQATGLALAVPVDELRRWLGQDAPSVAGGCVATDASPRER